jgi:glutathionylspermidine synthase
MQRHRCEPRRDWRERVEATGLIYHSHDNGPYWDESACYDLTADEVRRLEEATRALHFLCIDAAEAVVKNGWWQRLAIPDAAVPAIMRSWERDDFSLYGRFDLAVGSDGQPKMLEYNADTPTALVEAAVTQWFWLQETRPGADQFFFSSVKEQAEDEQTVLYLRDTCQQAGALTRSLNVEDIGWDAGKKRFVDLAGQTIERCFKLYPWEWLWHEEFGPQLAHDPVQFIEPAWKMLLSNKGLLPILWELFPGHPNLLPAFESAAPLGDRYVKKPKLSREGANIRWVEAGVAIEESDGDYGDEGHVFQAIAEPLDFDGNHPVFGAWVVDHEPAGLGIREDTRRITGNLSRFVPHFFQT